jgi:pyruvate/2-oxoglutarate dehydrogenase complex dihydrolipoamide acyltransferase (E2) component
MTMFGHRSDGYLVKKIDPIIALTPYLMPMRCDAQVFLGYKVDYETLARYLVAQGAEGHKLTFMEVIIAAFVRAVSELPEINRFISNKRMYARNELTVSFVALKDNPRGEIEENAVKCHFDPQDNIYDVAERVNNIVKDARKEEMDTAALKVAKALSKPILANPVVAIVRMMDRYGIMPRFLLDASPFHTSLFITNMASIGMPAVNHHIYNFGTTSMFWSIGAIERTVALDSTGKAVRKRMLPIGVTADERVCPGAVYAKMVGRMIKLMNDPKQLEARPESVTYDEGREYHVQKKKS